MFELDVSPHPVTILSQQLRALRLADSISVLKVRPDGEEQMTAPEIANGKTKWSVGVIGAGVSGLTFAAAFKALNPTDEVTVYDESPEADPFRRFAKSTRYIHPNIYDWPAPGAIGEYAPLPVFGWKAGRADEIAQDWIAELKKFEELPGFNIEWGQSIREVTSPDAQPEHRKGLKRKDKVFLNKESTVNHDIVIIATGFAAQSRAAKSRLWPNGAPAHIHVDDRLDYWTNATRELLGSTTEFSQAIFVGGGDSGIIEGLDVAYPEGWYKDAILAAYDLPSAFPTNLLRSAYIEPKPHDTVGPTSAELDALSEVFSKTAENVPKVLVYSKDGYEKASRLNRIFSEVANELSKGKYVYIADEISDEGDLPDYCRDGELLGGKKVVVVDRTSFAPDPDAHLKLDGGPVRSERRFTHDIESARRFGAASEFGFTESLELTAMTATIGG